MSRFRVPILVVLSVAVGAGLVGLGAFTMSSRKMVENRKLQEDLNQVRRQLDDLDKTIIRMTDYAEGLTTSLDEDVVSLEKLRGEEVSGKSERPSGFLTGELVGPKPVSEWLLYGVSRESHQQNLKHHLDTVRVNAALLSHRIKRLGEMVHYKDVLLQTIPSLMPVDGRISSGFGGRISPFTGEFVSHNGIDIAAPEGSPIVAPADGKVIHAGHLEAFGNSLTLQHENGIITRYAHAQTLLVKEGETVKRKQMIALVGNTGHSTGPHLHYEVWHGEKAFNPRLYIKETSMDEQRLLLNLAAKLVPFTMPDRDQYESIGGDSTGSGYSTLSEVEPTGKAPEPVKDKAGKTTVKSFPEESLKKDVAATSVYPIRPETTIPSLQETPTSSLTRWGHVLVTFLFAFGLGLIGSGLIAKYMLLPTRHAD